MVIQQLPFEIQHEIYQYLPLSTLRDLSLCKKYYYIVLLAPLYKDLDVKIRNLSADRSSLNKIRSYIENHSLCYYLHNITVSTTHPIEIGFDFFLRPVCMLLGVIIQISTLTSLKSFVWRLNCPSIMDLVRHFPSYITVLRLDTPLISCSKTFEFLTELQCRRVATIEELQWIKQQIIHGQKCLRKIFLSVDSFRAYAITTSFFQHFQAFIESSMQNTALTHLGLENIDLIHWSFKEIHSLLSLNLQHCYHVENALTGFLNYHQDQTSLKRLSLNLIEDQTNLAEILAKLSLVARLTNLNIYMEGQSRKFPLESVLLFYKTLQHLAIESRTYIMDPRSVCPYELEDLSKITSSCISLESLRIPLSYSKETLSVWVSLSNIEKGLLADQTKESTYIK